MNPRENPYTPGVGRRPPRLAGRDREIADFELLLQRLEDGLHERSMIVDGLRGVGKTVLLLEFDELARNRGWASTDVKEVGTSTDFRATFARMAYSLLRSLSRKERMKARGAKALEVVQAFSELIPGDSKLNFTDIAKATGIADSGDIEEDLSELMIEIGQVAAAGKTGVLFLLDEMQNLDDASLTAICMAFHRLSQKKLPVALVGAGLPSLPTKVQAARPYAGRLLKYPHLAQLSPAAAQTALAGPAATRSITFTPEAAEAAAEEAGRYPYFVQEFGRVLWDEAEEDPIKVEDVERSRDLFHTSIDQDFFAPRFNVATDREQRYLIGMAGLGDGPYQSADVAQAAGFDNQQLASPVRLSLIQKELLWSPRRGQLDFTLPRFAEYLRRLDE